MRKIIATVFVSSFLALLFLGQSHLVMAQASPAQSLTLTPFIFEERLEKGQTIQRQIELTNNSDEALRISTSLQDFTTGPRDGQPLFDTTATTSSSVYGLASWMKIISPPSKLLLPGQKTVATVAVSVPQNAEDGGKYGGVLFDYSSAISQTDGSRIVKKTGTLFFVRVGNPNEQGSLTKFAADKKFYLTGPIQFNAVFANTGNVHLAPKGSVHLYNIFGKMVAAIQINRDAQLVLPQTSRTFVAAWHDFWAIGPYRAELEMYYGDNNYEARAQTTVWIMPWKTVVIGLLSLIIVLALGYFGLRRYNRWIVHRHS